MEVVTLEKMKQHDSVLNAIKWAIQQRGEYPSRPPKPILNAKHNVDEARKHVEDFKQFELLKKEYENKMSQYRSRCNDIDNVIVQYIKEEAGLNSIPKQYQDKVYNKAYEDGHSLGFYEVFQKLISLVEIFD